MAQDRYILNFKGSPPLPADDVRLIRAKSHVVDSSRKTLLVEVQEDEVVYELARKLPDWTVKKETQYAVPTTRPRVKKTPKA
ncbi:hypothetical protein [Spirosoma montaniterrae]|uniref:Uncharacterized protein n=1 Tax=Spirosoma montaniterrae TaxID=1178516 RepID=A0A1P9WSX9_9BACT|nr:hypothetical protein [Spirosoma montaniterrae]AQG78469.1 hypothetical protein AWR27_03415 [Spirosoma montaniterrae]